MCNTTSSSEKKVCPLLFQEPNVYSLLTIYCHSRSLVLQSTKAQYLSLNPILLSFLIRNFKDDLHRWPNMPTLFKSHVHVFCSYEHIIVPGLIRI